MIGLRLDGGFAVDRWLNGLIGVVAAIRKRPQLRINLDGLRLSRLKLAFLALRLVPRFRKTHKVIYV